jgi:anaerobic magnesium-protoporphyrin IX monomethyl ester cyclase
MTARIALVSASAGRTDTVAQWPHYGLVLLATVLRKAGYDVAVHDQSFLEAGEEAFVAGVAATRPDLVGVSLYTTHASRGLRIASLLKDALPDARFVAGGPHASLYAPEVDGSGLFSAVVMGEAEGQIVEVVARTLAGERLGLVTGRPTEGLEIPGADYALAVGSERMAWMPIQLSRGCPFNCSFCEVKQIASRRIRYRDVDACLEEIAGSLARLRGVHTIRIVDDCPTLDRERFKEFLRRYSARKISARISVDNMRADSVDDELLSLLVKCRIPYVCIAVESGNPAVFRLVDKGESLDEVAEAARRVRRHGLPLYCCFVVGLPGSSFGAEMDSLRFAKTLRPDILYWNMFLPHRGTRAREWFGSHGTIFEEADRFSVPSNDLTFSLPATETPEFPREERIRAYLTCVLETVSFVMTPRALLRAVQLAHRYRLWGSFFVMLANLPAKVAVYARIALGRTFESVRRMG